MTVRSNIQNLAANSAGSLEVYCQAGETLTGGGFYSQTNMPVHVSRPTGGNTGWTVFITNNNASQAAIGVYAMCASNS